ncbi:ROK family transcriptional regulator [Actinocorallia longicatena]|uniref:ROK family protein n=1 Tax=Actinocorallia longicatena TaxID=111803 RepID=A0ABP6QH62_9ACTN
MATETPGAGALLALLREEGALTRAELATVTGLARSTISLRLDALAGAGWIMPADGAVSSGGRPATAFVFNPAARVVLAADLGATHARLAVTDLDGRILAERTDDLRIGDGPEKVLGWLSGEFPNLLGPAGRRLDEVCGLGLGLPGQVDHGSGRPGPEAKMPGWEGFDVPGLLGERLNVPVLVDNDVNIMAVGEHSTDPQVEHLILVKLGTGIGSGIITGRRLHRGARAAAGDVGHIPVAAAQGLPCACGKIGCLESVAGGAALAARLGVADTREVVGLVLDGRPDALRLVGAAGRAIGEVLGTLVTFVNPSEVVIAGDLAEAGEPLLSGIRERIGAVAVPRTTEHLAVRASHLGDRAGVTGAARLVIEHALAF